jgi:hypothetical protein
MPETNVFLNLLFLLAQWMHEIGICTKNPFMHHSRCQGFSPENGFKIPGRRHLVHSAENGALSQSGIGICCQCSADVTPVTGTICLLHHGHRIGDDTLFSD